MKLWRRKRKPTANEQWEAMAESLYRAAELGKFPGWMLEGPGTMGPPGVTGPTGPTGPAGWTGNPHAVPCKHLRLGPNTSSGYRICLDCGRSRRNA